MSNTPRFLFLTKRRTEHYGATKSSGLYNSAAQVVQMLAAMGCTTWLVDVVDGNDIDREIARTKATNVILEAFWVTPDKLRELVGLHPKVQFLVRNHSKTPFGSTEGIISGWMAEYALINNVTVAPNSLAVVDEMKLALDLPSLYLPNVYDKTSIDRSLLHRIERWVRLHGCQSSPKPWIPGLLRVGVFGVPRVLKNVAVQALAAIAYARENGLRLQFHINSSRLNEGQGQAIVKSIRSIFAAAEDVADLVEHDWLDRKEFLLLVARMDVVMQVSYTETFNIVLADACLVGTPVIGSADIEWLPRCLVADCNDFRSIAGRINFVLGHRRDDVSEIAQEALDRWTVDAGIRWTEYAEQAGLSRA